MTLGRFFILLAALYFVLRAADAFAMGGLALALDHTDSAITASEENHEGFQKFKKSCTNSPVFCGMAALSLSQMVLNLKGAKTAREVAQSFTSKESWPNVKPPGGGPSGAEIDKKIDFFTNQLPDLTKDLENSGGPKVDPETGEIQTKDGPKTVAELDSAEAMAEAGLIDPSQIPEMEKVLAEHKSGLKKVALQMTAGGGGGARAPTTTYTYDYGDSNSRYNYGRNQNKPAPPKTAGLVRMLGSDPIGASTGNIFDMIHRAYQQKMDEGIFVDP